MEFRCVREGEGRGSWAGNVVSRVGRQMSSEKGLGLKPQPPSTHRPTPPCWHGISVSLASSGWWRLGVQPLRLSPPPPIPTTLALVPDSRLLAKGSETALCPP